jgi:predicted NUDIX family phosphoesterase
MPQDENISVVHADELLKEYLTFRGFTSTLKVFDTERKYDKAKSYQV